MSPRLVVRLAVAISACLVWAATPASSQDTAASQTAPALSSAAPDVPAPPMPVVRRASAPAPTAPAAAPRPGAPLAPGEAIPPAELEAFVDGVVRQSMANAHIAGVAVSIVQNGRTVFKRGYGYASLSPVRPVDPDRTLFRLGSISKTFTWIAVEKEVERGRMGLANPVNQYLPLRLQVKDQGYARQVTLRDLMSHSAGFEDKTLGKLFERDPGRIRPLETYLRQESPRRVREAGATPVYSNYGVGLAGEAAAQVEGLTFQRLIENEVLRPLGLNQTTFREPYTAQAKLPEPMKPAQAQNLSDGFHWAAGAIRPRPFEYVTQLAPAGAASSTASDMARYMTMILNNGSLDGVTIYGPSTAQDFRTVMLRAAPGLNGWAHGFMEYQLPGGFVGYGHDGGTLSFHTAMVTVPELNLGVFAATNTDTGAALTNRLPQLIVEHFYGGTRLLPAGDRALASRRADFAGPYLTERRAYSGLEQFADLFGGAATIDVTPDGRLTTRAGGEQRTWTPTTTEGRFDSTDSSDVSVFEMQGGKAVRWFGPTGGESFKRASLAQRPVTVMILGLASIVAATATIIGLFLRDRRDFRQTSIQNRASALQTSTAALWLIAVAGFTAWALDARGDFAKAMYDWPGPWLMVASACALVAAILTMLGVLALPAIWRGGRRLDSWSAWRKLRFTATAVVFTALAVVLAMNGALEPWNT